VIHNQHLKPDFLLLQPKSQFEQILERLRRMPGAESVAGISGPPVNGLLVTTMAVTVEGGHTLGDTAYSPIAPNFFATMKTPLVRGRDFEAQDTASLWTAVRTIVRAK
jgi:hypothetical protein